MTFAVESLAPAHAVILVTHTGTVTAADMRSAGTKAAALAAGPGIVHLLSDFSEVTALPGMLEMLNLAQLLQEAGVAPGFRQALIWPADPQARIELDAWRMAEQNDGFTAQAFGNRESAIAWLES